MFTYIYKYRTEDRQWKETFFLFSGYSSLTSFKRDKNCELPVFSLLFDLNRFITWKLKFLLRKKKKSVFFFFFFRFDCKTFSSKKFNGDKFLACLITNIKISYKSSELSYHAEKNSHLVTYGTLTLAIRFQFIARMNNQLLYSHCLQMEEKNSKRL